MTGGFPKFSAGAKRQKDSKEIVYTEVQMEQERSPPRGERRERVDEMGANESWKAWDEG